MSLVFDEDSGVPVHFPKRRDVFEFDEEVSAIFEDMAYRSIPLYAEVHRLSAAFLEDLHQAYPDKKLNVLDVGSSTGMFWKAICNRFQKDPKEEIDWITAVSVDSSESMVENLHSDLPWVHTYKTPVEDFLYYEGADEQDGTPGANFDFINLSYVLQFIPVETRGDVIDGLTKMLNPGGMIVVAHKEHSGVMDRVFADMFTGEYIRFRKDNGYSDEEIAAKTEALKNAMWPMTTKELTSSLRRGGVQTIFETSRWLHFCSYLGVKQDA